MLTYPNFPIALFSHFLSLKENNIRFLKDALKVMTKYVDMIIYVLLTCNVLIWIFSAWEYIY